jgi:hypothetical protein
VDALKSAGTLFIQLCCPVSPVCARLRRDSFQVAYSQDIHNARALS